MFWGISGNVNSTVQSNGVMSMAPKEPIDKIWDDIFSTLQLEVEPPEYIKKITVYTRDGKQHNVTPEDFAQLIEYENGLPITHREIQSARMSLNFNKIKKDVNKWVDTLLDSFDKTGKAPIPKFPKPIAGVIKEKTRVTRKKPIA